MEGGWFRDHGSFVALLAIAAMLLAFQAEAQEESSPPAVQVPTEPVLTHPTALETYLKRPGILLVRQHHSLEPIQLLGRRKVRLDGLTAHEPGMQHQRVMGIRIEIDAPELTGEEGISYLDVHEIDELVRAIDFMRTAVEEGKPARKDQPTEMSISTRDGLRLGVRFAVDGVSHFLSTASATFEVPGASFEALRTTLDEGRERIFSD